ncbi:MAG: PilW family protein [Rubrivivax sp.]|nr:PilW family protein [Rubrivivax sp.]
MYAPERLQRALPRGLSMIEVMVGMVVSLLVGLAAAGSAQMFLASQRQGIGTGGTLVNASTALAAIRDDVATGGLGFFGDKQYLCTKLNLSVETTVVQDGVDFLPVRITAEASGDRIDIASATQVASGANVLLKSASTGAAAEVRSLLPVVAGQAVLLAPATPGQPCLVRSVTAVTASTDTTPQLLTFGAAGRFNQKAFTTNPTYTANDYPDIGRVALLGDLRWTRYRREGTDLRLERPFGGDPVVLVRNVVAFRAQYGIAAAAAGSTALESWTDASGGFETLTAALLPRVRAIRIGVVTRSTQAEKPDANGICQATTAMPALFGTAVVSDVDNWRCFRYRTAIVVVPMRNLVIGMTS